MKSLTKLVNPLVETLGHDREIAFIIAVTSFTTRLFFSHTLANSALLGKLNRSRNALLCYAVSLVAFSLSRSEKNKNKIWTEWYEPTGPSIPSQRKYLNARMCYTRPSCDTVLLTGIVMSWLNSHTSSMQLSIEVVLLKTRTYLFPFFYWFKEKIPHPSPAVPVMCILNCGEATLPAGVLPNLQPANSSHAQSGKAWNISL